MLSILFTLTDILPRNIFCVENIVPDVEGDEDEKT